MTKRGISKNSLIKRLRKVGMTLERRDHKWYVGLRAFASLREVERWFSQPKATEKNNEVTDEQPEPASV